MPVAAQIGRSDRDGNHVSGAGGDVAVAAGTQVHLVCFVGLHSTCLGVSPQIWCCVFLHQSFSVMERAYPKKAHTMRAMQATTPMATYQ